MAILERERDTKTDGGMGTVSLKIEGMTCAACVRRVEKALERVPGVQSATVSLATEEARVTSTGVAFDRLRQAVETAGYGARLKADRDESAEDGRATRAGVLFAVSAALTLPLLAPMIAA